jgi:hypothetical protein
MGCIRPANVEQILQEDRVVLVRLQKEFPISRVDRSFVAGKKTSPNPSACRTQRQSRGKTPSIRYSTRGNHRRRSDGIDYGPHQRHRRHRAPNVAPRFPSLGDYNIDATIYGPLGVKGRTHGVHDDCAAGLCARHQGTGVTPEDDACGG